jgi:hypothetical protein
VYSWSDIFNGALAALQNKFPGVALSNDNSVEQNFAVLQTHGIVLGILYGDFESSDYDASTFPDGLVCCKSISGANVTHYMMILRDRTRNFYTMPNILRSHDLRERNPIFFEKVNSICEDAARCQVRPPRRGVFADKPFWSMEPSDKDELEFPLGEEIGEGREKERAEQVRSKVQAALEKEDYKEVQRILEREAAQKRQRRVREEAETRQDVVRAREDIQTVEAEKEITRALNQGDTKRAIEITERRQKEKKANQEELQRLRGAVHTSLGTIFGQRRKISPESRPISES